MPAVLPRPDSETKDQSHCWGKKCYEPKVNKNWCSCDCHRCDDARDCEGGRLFVQPPKLTELEGGESGAGD